MRFSFTPDQQLFRDTVRELLRKECPPEAVRAAWSSDDGRVPGLWSQLAEMGVVGLTVGEAHGGLGMDDLDLVLLLEEAGRAAVPEPLAETTAVAAPLLEEVAADGLGGEWLPRVAAGEAVLTVGLAGQPYVAAADVADLLLLQHGDELHAVAGAAVERTRQPSVDGARRIFSVGWEPGPGTLVASGPQAAEALDRAADRGALAAAAQLLGVAAHLVAVSVEYATQRQQFGSPIGSFQAVKHHLANAYLGIDFAKPVVYRAAYTLSRGEGDRRRDVSMAKAAASDAALAAAKIALQVHGAIGYTFEYDLHLWMKRAWVLAGAWGDAATHRARVADLVLGPRP